MAEAEHKIFDTNPFEEPERFRRAIRKDIQLSTNLEFNGNGFICSLINSRCPVGCEHCMFGSNMAEEKNSFNTMTEERVDKLMQLVRDSNTGYLLVSGGGEGFLEPNLMYQIVEKTAAEITWMVTGAHWAKSKDRAREVVEKMYAAFCRGTQDDRGNEICLRISLDSYHIEKIGRSDQNSLQYVENLVRIYESDYADEENFTLQLHSIKGEEELIDTLVDQLNGTKLEDYDSFHDEVKVTENAFTIELESGYEFEVTFAKRLYSDIAADLNDEELLQKRITVFEKDAFENENGRPAIKQNADGRIGPNMLVTYDGRVSFWQSEMPDVPLNIDSDGYDTILEKSFSDPGVLATVENGLKYRYDIINEVCPKAVTRSKAVNVRDYTSLVLLEEDKVKLYYTVRALHDFIAQSRIEGLNECPPDVRRLVHLNKSELQALYHTSDYDIVQQFIEHDESQQFHQFVECIKRYARENDPQVILEFFNGKTSIDSRTVDEWRLLLERMANGWYDIKTLSTEEVAAVDEIERIMDNDLLGGKRIYEGLSAR